MTKNRTTSNKKTFAATLAAMFFCCLESHATSTNAVDNSVGTKSVTSAPAAKIAATVPNPTNVPAMMSTKVVDAKDNKKIRKPKQPPGTSNNNNTLTKSDTPDISTSIDHSSNAIGTAAGAAAAVGGSSNVPPGGNGTSGGGYSPY